MAGGLGTVRGQGVVREAGWPDEMQAREMMIEAKYRLGSWKAFCDAVGLSRRYVNLIMEWMRPPTHCKLMEHFGWSAVYAMSEDLLQPESVRRKPGRKPLSILERIDRQITKEANVNEQRAYWRRKQKESRERRKQIYPV